MQRQDGSAQHHDRIRVQESVTESDQPSDRPRSVSPRPGYSRGISISKEERDTLVPVGGAKRSMSEDSAERALSAIGRERNIAMKLRPSQAISEQSDYIEPVGNIGPISPRRTGTDASLSSVSSEYSGIASQVAFDKLSSPISVQIDEEPHREGPSEPSYSFERHSPLPSPREHVHTSLDYHSSNDSGSSTNQETSQHGRKPRPLPRPKASFGSHDMKKPVEQRSFTEQPAQGVGPWSQLQKGR